jgi:hypothetical protein
MLLTHVREQASVYDLNRLDPPATIHSMTFRLQHLARSTGIEREAGWTPAP